MTSLLGRIIEQSLHEIYAFDADTLRFVDVNRGARMNLGYSLEELRALTPIDIKPEFTADAFAELLEPLRNGSRDQIYFETIHLRKDGSTYHIAVNLQFVAHKKPPVFIASIQEIDERTRADRALRESERRFKDFAEASSDWFWEMDRDLRFTQFSDQQPVWNRQSERVFAYHACPHLPSAQDDRGNDETETYSAENPIAVDIDAHLLSWLAEHSPKSGSSGSWAMTILPINYPSLVGNNRNRLAEAFEAIAKSGLSKLVMIEIAAISDSADAEAVHHALAMPSQFSHPLIVRGSPDRKFVPWARKAGAAFLSLQLEADNDDGNRQRHDRRMKNFTDGARALGLKPYIHGLNTMGGVKQAVAAEVPLLAGSAFDRVLDHPGETYRLRKERLLIG